MLGLLSPAAYHAGSSVGKPPWVQKLDQAKTKSAGNGAAMQQIADWLEKLGLGQYAQRFAENDINFALLSKLTDADLNELGVTSLGHRKRLLEAIANLDKVAVQSAPSIASPPAVTTPVTLPADAFGERRHITVMFSDLVDSTGIASRLDAEEWRDLVGAYLDAASRAVSEMGGKVAKKLGDGLMALFGYPVAQENDAERAVRAALVIQRSLTELNRKNEGSGKPILTARIAIECGPVVIDELGEIFGDVPNIAARAQALAEPGAVVVTGRVHRQVAGLFVAEERGGHDLKGVPEPVTLFQFIRASGAGRRARQRHLTPLVGRDEEIAVLMRRWERARQGDGQLVMIVGEPGLGRSRLIEEFHTRLREVPHTWVEWSCSQLLQNTPLHPIAEWGRQRFGGADVPAEQRLADLENTLALIKLDPAENVPLLAALLDIPLPQERAPTLAPEELRRRQVAALTAWAMSSARVQPAVLALEDVHWADPTTLEVVRGIAERGELAPLFVLMTARPDPTALEHALTSHDHLVSTARPPSGAGYGGRACRSTRVSEGTGRDCHRTQWWCTAIHRRSDEALFGIWAGRQCQSNPTHPATIVDGAARSARPRTRAGADRCGDRAQLLLSAHSHCRRVGGCAAAGYPGAAR